MSYPNYQTQQFLPTGNILCPASGCKGFDPSNLGAGLDGFAGIVVTIAELAVYLLTVISVLYIIIATYIMLLGGEGGRQKGFKLILNALIAIVIAVLSFPAVQILINFLDSFQLN